MLSYLHNETRNIEVQSLTLLYNRAPIGFLADKPQLICKGATYSSHGTINGADVDFTV
jgi:hypothetical protein